MTVFTPADKLHRLVKQALDSGAAASSRRPRRFSPATAWHFASATTRRAIRTTRPHC